ncbi:MAG: MFS transporter [Geminicoccaceae bacterium]|nr:MFS transporter [Geminicoccaceae bacterium]
MPASTLIAYGALGLPLAALNLPLYVYLPPYYASDLGLGLGAVGAVLFVARMLDVVTDPLIGEASDRLPTRFGRRRPWLVLACPVLLLSTWMLFVPGEEASLAGLFLWTSISYVAWTAMILPYTALGAELSSDYHERSRITGVREGFVILGILSAAALPALLGLEAEAANAKVLAMLALAMTVLVPLALLALLLRVAEPPAAPEAEVRFVQGLRVALANRPFVRLVGAYLLNGIANGLPATLFLLFVGDVIERPDLGGPLLLVYFLAGVVAIPGWLWLSQRIGKHRAWAAAMLWASLAFAWAPWLGPGDVMAFFAICLLSGLSLGADLALPASMQADVVDLDWARSGRRRTGLFFALWSMTTKLSLALAVGIAFPILDLLGYQADGSSEVGLLGLALLYGLLPVAIKLVATAIVWNFPLGEAFHEDTLRRLREGAPAAAD